MIIVKCINQEKYRNRASGVRIALGSCEWEHSDAVAK